LANELSRISERLIRTRERNGNGAATVWLPPPARREPTRRDLPRDPPEKPKEPAAHSSRGPATWVAIHVQLRHEHDPVPPNVFDATQDQELDDEEVYVEAAPIEFEDQLPRKALPAQSAQARAVDGFFVPRTLASEGKATRATGILQYLATRALNAYLTQSSFGSVAASEQRMLDVQA
jgi:hypothetical protein